MKEELVEEVGNENFNLCMTDDCNVVYFQPDKVFHTSDLYIPVWFKKNADPKYICYCNKVTQEQIEDAVINRNANNLKDVVRLTGAMKNGQCLLKNPTGKCCSPVIQDVIALALKRRETMF